MPKEPNKKAVGIFLIVGFILFTIIVGHAVIGRLFNRDQSVAIMYFDESVKGLNVGSPVVFNGVEIGKVTKIELIGDPQNMTFSVPVYVRLTPMQETGGIANQIWRGKTMLDLMIEKGLRARLLTQSYLTGQLMIELSMLPNTPINLKNAERDSRRNIPEIPTVLSPSGELSKGLQDLPIRRSMEKMEKILDSLQKQLPVILPALASASKNLADITEKIAPQSDDIVNNLNKALYDISDAARSLRNFADYVERHPESLLKGKKGD